MIFKKPNFGPPPPGYIAGLGRGASGFVTRADYGPSKVGGATVTGQQDLQVNLQFQIPDHSQFVYRQGPPGLQSNVKQAPTAALRELTSIGQTGQTERGEDYSDRNYDEWSGFQGSLFSGVQADAEDKDADNVFSKVDDFMEQRRKRKREEKFKEEEKTVENSYKDYQAQFADVKKQLANVSRAEWESLPEAPDLVKRTKKQREQLQRYTPVPDSVINSALQENQTVSYVDSKLGGTQSSLNSGMQSLTEVGQARGQLLSIKLDRASDSVSGQSTVNKEGYMTDLNSMIFNKQHEINDINKARALLKSVITNNPNSSSGWIAAARVEELDGKIQQARNIMAQACQHFLDNEDIWLEAARLSPPEKTKALLAKAVSQMPKSKKLWLQAARKENDLKIKSQIFQRALEQIPNDVELWKEAIQMESPEEAKTLLYKAVKCIPDSTELWLALAKLEDYENAQSVLGKALESLPTDFTLWVNAAKLEEAQGNVEKVQKIIGRAIRRLDKHGVKLKRDQWLNEAVEAEKGESLVTCRAIVKETMKYGLEEYVDEQADEQEKKKQTKNVWVDNAEECLNRGAIETARALYFNALIEFPQKKSLWFAAIKLEREFGTKENLEKLLQRAKDQNPHELFFLMYAKHLFKVMKKPEQAKQILMEGLEKNQSSQQIVLALQKIERESKNFGKAEEILTKALDTNPNERIHMQLVQLYREIENYEKTLDLLKDGLVKYPNFHKLWLIKAQVLEKLNDIEGSRQAYEEALKVDSLRFNKTIWLCFAQFEERQLAYTRARTILQKARIKIPKDEDVWIESIRLEIKSDNLKISENLLSRALQECPESGRLWAIAVELEPVSTRKAKIQDALQKNDKDSDIFIAGAKTFWMEKKPEKTRKWLKQAVALNKDNGDAWAHYFRFECDFGNEETQKQVIEQVEEADPHHGDLWTSESKKVENWRLSNVEILKKVAYKVKLFK